MPEETVIEVRDLQKRYRLGMIGGATLADDLKVWWARLRGKPNPLIPLDAKFDSARVGDQFFALRKVSFDVKQGEILGIIGQNGAGKSTLLKLLSRITTPTEGTIKIKGRTSSLLEVGTGFHPELTGMENIYLNGSILGMRRAEIDQKLDEIIEFSGIKHHIDTPVKRYSSGMKVRLGFAVAAHLEPEVLIIDEVLAVGDADFQRKCIGKMKDVAGSGRTIIFVSHNMVSVQSLCTRAIWLKNGMVELEGDVYDVVKKYLSEYDTGKLKYEWDMKDAPGTEHISITRMEACSSIGNELITIDAPARVEIDVHVKDIPEGDLNVVIYVQTEDDILAFSSGLAASIGRTSFTNGLHQIWCELPANLLNVGSYGITIIFFHNGKKYYTMKDTLSIEVHENERSGSWYGKRNGIIRPALKWGVGN